jgi:hypothetical protein
VVENLYFSALALPCRINIRIRKELFYGARKFSDKNQENRSRGAERQRH